jgi:hypothetical protein
VSWDGGEGVTAFGLALALLERFAQEQEPLQELEQAQEPLPQGYWLLELPEPQPRSHPPPDQPPPYPQQFAQPVATDRPRGIWLFAVAASSPIPGTAP